MTRTVVAMNAQGRVTLPAKIRRQLGLTDGAQLEVGVKQDQITLRPARIIPAEDAWAYTAENMAGIRRALDDARAGRVYQLSEEDLLLGRYPRRGKPRVRRSGR